MATIKNKLVQNAATITKADKGNTTVIMLLSEYNLKITEYIKNNNILELPNDPTKSYKTLTNNLINSSNKIIDTKHKYHLKMIKPTAPQFRGLPKIHKTGMPIRPLINYRTAPAYKLSKYMNKYLHNMLNITGKTTIKNNLELIEKIKHIAITNNCKLASFDISNMYGNIPINETLEIIKQRLTHKKIQKTEIEQAVNIINLISGQNYFQHGTKYYTQPDGLPMGNPLSGTLAEIFIDNLEQEHVLNNTNPFSKNIVYWHRYVDDILILFNGTSRQLKLLHKHINNIHSNIKFTIETEQHKQINFLDISITNNNNKHSFNIYRKPTQTNHTLHNTSNHPQQHKRAAYHHMITRLNRIPLSTTNYNQELETIKQIATENGYNTVMIDKMNHKYKHKQLLRSRTTLHNQKEEKKKYITIEYDNNTKNTIHRTFTTQNYHIAFKTSNTIEKLTQRTTHNECETGVYKVKCDDCNAFYIGQTGRNFKTRYQEHINEIGKQNIKSNFASHLTTQQHNHTSYHNNLEILHRLNKGERLNRKEEIEIYKHRHNPLLLNDKTPANAIYEKILKNF